MNQKHMDGLAEELDRLSKAVKDGKVITALERFAGWNKPPAIAKSGQTGGGLGDATPEQHQQDRAMDRQASRYQAEAATLLPRILSDLVRANRLVEIGNPPTPRQITGRDMLAAQVAAQGYCVSCFRNDQHLTDIELRRSNGPDKGTPYYRDLCRFCGGWKTEYGDIPPLDVIQRHHDGRRITKKAG